MHFQHKYRTVFHVKFQIQINVFVQNIREDNEWQK